MSVVQTFAGRGGPGATETTRSTFPTGRFIHEKPIPDLETSMPPCPVCEGTGEKLMVGELTCPLCKGLKALPRFIYESIVLDLAVLSLELE